MNRPTKVAIIGFDCAEPALMARHFAEGLLPNFKRVFDSGIVADHCLVPFPTITPPNWATIGTGALIGTHQVVDYWVPIPGKTPHSDNTVQAFSSDRVKAEFIWDAADKAGKKCVVLNYPGSWPNHMQNGIVVGGAALGPIDFMEGRRESASVSVCTNQLIATDFYPGAIRGKFVPADGWAQLDEGGEEPLELEAPLNFPFAVQAPAPTTWWVLARQSTGDAYDSVSLCPTKDLGAAFCTLRVGEWSPKLYTTIKMADGSERNVEFKCKLLELSEDAEEFRLYVTSLANSGWLFSPADAFQLVDSPEAVPVSYAGMVDAQLGRIDWDTWVEATDEYSRWLGDVATSLLRKGDWDLFAMHSHPTDFGYHILLNDLEPLTSTDSARQKKAWDIHLKMYEVQDRLLGRLLALMPEDTLVVLVSDHGAVADGPVFDPFKALEKAGLATILEEVVPENRLWEVRRGVGQLPPKVDIANAKALARGGCYVHVHLKGRDPEGIVEPEDYETVRDQIIDALYAYVDPDTGKRPVALALSKEDARLLGLYGEGVGDVVYAIYPWFGGQHGNILPTAEWGLGSLRALLVFSGPGIRKGARLQRTVGLQDIVPTACYAASFPMPQTVDGAVIFQVFEDPDFKQKEVADLTDALAKMEAALAGKEPEA